MPKIESNDEQENEVQQFLNEEEQPNDDKYSDDNDRQKSPSQWYSDLKNVCMKIVFLVVYSLVLVALVTKRCNESALKALNQEENVDPPYTPVGYCILAPQADRDYSQTPCFIEVKNRILATYNESIQETNLPPLRWLFFGDSTMTRLYNMGKITEILSGKYKNPKLLSCNNVSCYQSVTTQCNLNKAYGFPPLLDDGYWRHPDFSLGEGPIKFGLDNSNCQDCGGCNSLFNICKRTTTSKEETNIANNEKCGPMIYGGYFSIEYARDVEVQTTQYSTTQENVAQFIKENYNQDLWLLNQFGGSPVCVVSTGFHDIGIPNITMATFIKNAEWWVDLLLQNACGHIIWLSNTAPQRKSENDYTTTEIAYIQTQVSMKELNLRVYQRLNETTQWIRDRITIVDPFEASINYPHMDNIHMADSWYQSLGSFFQQVIKSIATIQL